MIKKVFYFNTNLSRIATSPDDFVERFTLYSRYLQFVSDDVGSFIEMIVGGLPKSSGSRYPKLTYVSRNPFSQFFILYKKLKMKSGPKILISGDNDLSLLMCLLVKAIVPQVGVQISIHASYDAIFLSRGVKAIIRRRLLQLGISRAKSIRIVADGDLQKFQTSHSKNASKIFVSPIPINIPSNTIDTSNKTKVALVGRLHEERGLFDAIEIFRKLDQNAESQDLLIVGSGPEEARLKRELGSNTHITTQFLGQLKQEQLSLLWSEIKVLVSCAPQESYGMALREALVNGTYVVAKKNQTTAKLEENYPELMSTYLDPGEGARLIIEKQKMSPSTESVRRIGKSLESQQESYMLMLAKSWID